MKDLGFPIHCLPINQGILECLLTQGLNIVLVINLVKPCVPILHTQPTQNQPVFATLLQIFIPNIQLLLTGVLNLKTQQSVLA